MEALGHSIVSDYALYLHGEDATTACDGRSPQEKGLSLKVKATTWENRPRSLGLSSFELKLVRAPRQKR